MIFANRLTIFPHPRDDDDVFLDARGRGYQVRDAHGARFQLLAPPGEKEGCYFVGPSTGGLGGRWTRSSSGR